MKSILAKATRGWNLTITGDLINDARMHQSQRSAYSANVHPGRRCDRKQDGIRLGPGVRRHKWQACWKINPFCIHRDRINGPLLPESHTDIYKYNEKSNLRY